MENIKTQLFFLEYYLLQKDILFWIQAIISNGFILLLLVKYDFHWFVCALSVIWLIFLVLFSRMYNTLRRSFDSNSKEAELRYENKLLKDRSASGDEMITLLKQQNSRLETEIGNIKRNYSYSSRNGFFDSSARDVSEPTNMIDVTPAKTNS